MKSVKKRVFAAIVFTLVSVEQCLAELVIEQVTEVEIITVDENGKEQVERKPADEVIPGSIIVYTITATNEGEAPADDVVVRNSISEHVTYIMGSAQTNAMGKNTETTFSVNNGESFDEKDSLIVLKDGVEQMATAEDYTDISWKLKFSLPPEKSVKFWFKARVK